MNARVNDLAFAILKKNIDDCSNDELRQLCNQFPYYAPLQLVYAQKLRSAGDPAADRQVQKASLFFSNPLWLDYLLSGPATVVKTKSAPAGTTGIAIQEAEVVNELTVETNEPGETADHSPLPAEVNAIANEPVETVTVEDEPNETEETVEEDSSPAMALPQLKIEPIDPATAPLSFEPYHTVDYFASQGIRFKEEAKPEDRFSQQLKSFTEWLKTMKRLPPSENEIPEEKGQVEEKVEQMAALSITDREVVTEAMAEVWEKQGDRKKAIAIYEKLSLLDPSKSAYFAAKIEVLK
jgi:hypothetical protein